MFREPATDQGQDMQFHIPATDCTDCVRSVTRAVSARDSGARVTAGPATRRIGVASTAAAGLPAPALAEIGHAPATTGDI